MSSPFVVKLTAAAKEIITLALRMLSLVLKNGPRPQRVLFFVTQGVEFTQAIQFFHTNDEPFVLHAPNSLPLVAGKPTAVRVYFDRPLERTDTREIRCAGRLRIAGFPGYVANSSNVILASDPRSLNGQRRQALNFLLPVNACTGEISISVEIFAIDMEARPDWTIRKPLPWLEGSAQGSFTFTDVSWFPVQPVLIHYRHAGLDLPAPTYSDFVQNMRHACANLPTPGPDYAWPPVEVDYDASLQSLAEWHALYAILQNSSTLATAKRPFVGLLPQATPRGASGVAGVGEAPGVLVLRGYTAALGHELGHLLGRGHVPNTSPLDPGSDDVNFPQFPGLARGAIGEYGYDVLQPPPISTFPPATFDLMYGVDDEVARWISPYTWSGMMEAIVRRWGSGPFANLAATMSTRSTANVAFGIDEDGALQLHFAFVFEQAWSEFELNREPRMAAQPNALRIEMFDDAQQLLQTHRVDEPAGMPRSSTEARRFFERIPWSDRIRALRVFSGSREVGAWHVKVEAPELGRVTVAESGKHALAVSWKAAHSSLPLQYCMRFSNDDGATWIATVPLTSKTSAIVRTRVLKAGDRCRFQVLASAGFQTTLALSEPFQLSAASDDNLRFARRSLDQHDRTIGYQPEPHG